MLATLETEDHVPPILKVVDVVPVLVATKYHHSIWLEI